MKRSWKITPRGWAVGGSLAGPPKHGLSSRLRGQHLGVVGTKTYH